MSIGLKIQITNFVCIYTALPTFRFTGEEEEEFCSLHFIHLQYYSKSKFKSM